MSLPTIDQSFIEEFEAGVHMAYQRQGSKLRGTVRTVNNVKNKTTFQKVGKGSATQKARHGEVPPMNIDHTNVSVTLDDWYAGEYIDKLDQLRQNHDEFMVAQQSGAYALGRKTDEILLDAMDATTNTSNETTNGITLSWAQGLMETFGNADVPDDGQRFAVIGWENWTQLMNIDQFSRAEYIGEQNLPFAGAMTAKTWLTFMWVPFSGLQSINADADRKCFAYHKTGVGHAIGADVSTEAQYIAPKVSWWVNHMMQMGAVVIDETSVYECQLKK